MSFYSTNFAKLHVMHESINHNSMFANPISYTVNLQEKVLELDIFMGLHINHKSFHSTNKQDARFATQSRTEGCGAYCST